MKTKLDRIAEIAKERPNEKFTSLVHLLNEEMLMQCHKEISGNKATGIDRVTKAEYEQDLNSNIKELVAKLKRRAYRPQPARRVNIPKPGSDKTRPLGVLAYEDKIVQRGMAKILNSITFDFLGFTHYCSKSQQGKFRVKRRTCRKKYKAALLKMKEWIKANRTTHILKIMKELNVKLRGHYQYYGITDNTRISSFYHDTKLLLYKWLNRRSQRASFGWDKYNLFLMRHAILKPKVYVNIYDISNRIGNVT